LVDSADKSTKNKSRSPQGSKIKMTDIRIPLEELERAANGLAKVLDLLEQGTRPPDADRMLGAAPDVLDAAHLFDKRWSDGRKQMLEEGRDIRDKVLKVVESFKATDDQLAKSLDQNAAT
jgi:hypothetical protein